MMLFVRAWLVLGERVIEMEAEIEMVWGNRAAEVEWASISSLGNQLAV
jgi:hypothetical protein